MQNHSIRKPFAPISAILLAAITCGALFSGCAGGTKLKTSPEFERGLRFVVTRPVSQITSPEGTALGSASTKASVDLQASILTTLHFGGYGEAVPDTGKVGSEADVINTIRQACDAKDLSKIAIAPSLASFGTTLPGDAYAITWQVGVAGKNSDVGILVIDKRKGQAVLYAHDKRSIDPNDEEALAAQVEAMLRPNGAE